MCVKPLGPACAAVLGAALLAACAAAPAPADMAAHHHAAGQASIRAGMERLATAAGCARPAMQVDAAELREAACRTSRGQYTLLTFATGAGERAWLDDAEAYGGSYLVGDRWVVVAAPALLEGVRRQVGGTVEAAHHH
ncbi:putative lipoprotein [[Actinomadura] parvosata subsp. kistnae]|uniref:Lipoprotein n=1 Tax=[Actinomadura] parvosata subsp. kistnae TaxID=1909395 RepID=A0A1V0A0Z0_9ACTN|nr:hypothetical protein [Nonomuraea sp. ATCC 55076]AQZ63860.1 hypothetical protein BKM31_22490 [Nonomuraea sp. ATCC 55076]SPL89693.1 putative lipoprotein [Actinomadura parvosata subsp. kistnae]